MRHSLAKPPRGLTWPTGNGWHWVNTSSVVHLQSFSRACNLKNLCLYFAQFKLEKHVKLIFLSISLTFRTGRSEWGGEP